LAADCRAAQAGNGCRSVPPSAVAEWYAVLGSALRVLGPGAVPASITGTTTVTTGSTTASVSGTTTVTTGSATASSALR
jgi:hypothetical protein